MRDAEGKRRQLLEAGLIEFAAHGIAGARVDRIAKRAGCSAGLVYTYFTSKDELFEAVFDATIEQTRNDAPITVQDLPDYAGRLFDARRIHPEAARLLDWYALERPGTTRPAALTSARAKIDAIRTAQGNGKVSTRFTAEQILHLIMRLAARGAEDPHNALDPAAEREMVVEAVRLLTEI